MKEDIDEKLKQKKKWKDIQAEFEKIFQSTVEKQKVAIIETLERCSDQFKVHYEEANKIINDVKINPDNNFIIEELKIYISNKLGEKNNYKEAIDNIVNDIVANSRTATTWKNSTGFFEFLKSKFSDKAYLNKTIDFIISNAIERLKAFKQNISNLIDEYSGLILNKVNIEKINIVNVLEEKMKKKDLENIELEKENNQKREEYEKIKKENEEKNKKWNEICAEYNTVKILIDNIFNEAEINENISTEEGETPNPD